jgi:hypothetical protein
VRFFFKKNLHGNPVWSAGLILKQSPSWTLRGFLARACFISRAPQQTPIAEAETTAVTSRLDHKQTPKARKNPADYSTSTSVVVHESVAKLRKVLEVYDARLAVSRYLAGDDLTAADLSGFVECNVRAPGLLDHVMTCLSLSGPESGGGCSVTPVDQSHSLSMIIRPSWLRSCLFLFLS